MTLKHPRLLTFRITSGSIDPAASTTYYFGGTTGAPSTTAALQRIYMPKKGRIISADIDAGCSAGTAEAVIMRIRVNNATDTTVDTRSMNVTFQHWYNHDLNIAVAEGDYVEIKLATPAWVAAPTFCRFWGHIVVAVP